VLDIGDKQVCWIIYIVIICCSVSNLSLVVIVIRFVDRNFWNA